MTSERNAVVAEIMDGYYRGQRDALRAALATFRQLGDERGADLLEAMLDVVLSKCSS